MNVLFSARKKIYWLERSESRLAQALLHILLASYRVVDRRFLKRATRPDNFSEKLVSDDRKIVCVLTPKVASRTLLDGMRSAARAEHFNLRISQVPLSKLSARSPEYYTFAFVRDPWARCYSCYVQKIRQYTPIKGALHFSGRNGLDPAMSFENFVEWLLSPDGGDEIADRHWMSQFKVLGLHEGFKYDYVGKLENLTEDLRFVARRIDIDPNHFGHRLQTSVAGEHLRHYTPRLVDMVGERYKVDAEAFGYRAPGRLG